MILDYDKRPDATIDEKIRSLKDSVQLALNRIEGSTLAGSIDGTQVKIINVQGGSLVGTIDGNYVFVKNLDAAAISTGDLSADRMKTNVIDAVNASIDEIDADRIDVDSLVAKQAFLDAVTAEVATVGYLTADAADLAYAQIDGANITSATIRDAWVDNLMVQSGLLANSGTVFTLDAIQVNAANITAGTLDVERLIVTVSGEKYMVSFDAQGSPTYEKLDGNIIEDNTITADKILAHSITANEITTQNLVGTSGWINLAAGVFAYVNASEGTGIVWDGTDLTINASSITLGGDNLATAIASAQAAADAAIKTVEYAVGTSSTTAPSTGWSTNSPQWESGKYVWMRQSKDGTNYTYTCIQGAQGPQGEQGETGASGTSITITNIKYAAASTDSQPQDSEFGDSIPTVAEGSWLWTRTLFSDGSKVYTKAKQGKSGTNGTNGTDGHSPVITTTKSGTTTTIYADGVSIGTVDDGADGTTPTVTATKTGSTTYISVNGTQVAQIDDGADGQDGQDGQNGDDGTSVASVTPFYRLDTDTPTQPSDNVMTPTGWETSEPQYDSEYNCYVSFRTVYDDSTEQVPHCKWSSVSMSSSYEAAKQANDTANALQGDMDEVNRVLEEDIGSAIESLQGDMEEVTGTVSGMSGDINSLDGRTTATEETLENILPDIQNMRGMIDIHPKVPEIIVRAGTNKVRITETEIQFLVGSDNRKVAYLSGTKLYITESEVTNTQRIGPFIWFTQSDETTERVSMRYSPVSTS